MRTFETRVGTRSDKLSTKRCGRGLLLAVCAVVLAASCGGGKMRSTLPVSFEYLAPTQIDPQVDFDTCTPSQVRFTTHLHFTWNEWDDRRYMTADGPDRFTYTGQVPVGRDLAIALHDPNNCLQGGVYVAPTTLYANGVLLTRQLQVLTGTGVAFRQQSDGTIVP